MELSKLVDYTHLLYECADTPSLSGYLTSVLTDVVDFIDSEGFQDQPSDLVYRYLLLRDVLQICIGAVRYKGSDKLLMVRVLRTIINDIINYDYGCTNEPVV